MPSIELGGNFCLSEEQISMYDNTECTLGDTFWGWKDLLFTHGGRSAIVIAIRNLGLCNSIVLVPNFSCHSITDAFHECGCEISYYKVNVDLTINICALMRQINEVHPSILFTCSLFGFDTLASFRPYYKQLQDRGIKIIEDVTHSILGIKPHLEADRIVCSLRKWFEIPDGGFVWGLKDFDKEDFYSSIPENKQIVDNFIGASKGKLEYLRTKDESLKNSFLPLFYKNNDLFDNCAQIYRMSTFSYKLLQKTDFGRIAISRNENYRYLLQNITNPLIEVIQKDLMKETVPLYMQIYVKNGRRSELQKLLIAEKLYCPVIWPTPKDVEEHCSPEDITNHKNMLSLVIDQRYDMEDMERLTNSINKFK